MGSHNNTNTLFLYFSSWLSIKLIESRQHREGCCTASSASSRVQASPLLRWAFCYKHGWEISISIFTFFTFFSLFQLILFSGGFQWNHCWSFCRGVTFKQQPSNRFVSIIPSNPVSKTSWGNPRNVAFCQSNNYPQGFAMIVRVVFLAISLKSSNGCFCVWHWVWKSR